MKSLIILLLSLMALTYNQECERPRLADVDILPEQKIVANETCPHFDVAFNGSWEAVTVLTPTESTIETTVPFDETSPTDSQFTEPTKETTQIVAPTEPNVDNSQNNKEETTQPTTPPATEPPVVETTPPPTETHPPEIETTPTTQEQESTKPTEPPIEETKPTEPVETPTTPTRPKCTTHDLQFTKTVVDTEYQLYNYVTDYYKCVNCEYTSSESHIASNGISASGIASAEYELYAALNQLRKSQGLSELWRNDFWDDWATTRAKELSVKYGHARPNGSSWTNADGTYFTIGENVAAGNSSGYDFYLAFLNSGSHYGTMTLADAVGVGIGIYVDENGKTYCAMVLVAHF